MNEPAPGYWPQPTARSLRVHRVVATLFGATAQPARRAKIKRGADGSWWCWISNHGELTAGYAFDTWPEAAACAVHAVKDAA